MSNGKMLDELRQLAKEENIDPNTYRRLSLASQAEIYESLHGKKGLIKRMDEVEKKVSIQGRAEIALIAIAGWLSANIKL